MDPLQRRISNPPANPLLIYLLLIVSVVVANKQSPCNSPVYDDEVNKQPSTMYILHVVAANKQPAWKSPAHVLTAPYICRRGVYGISNPPANPQLMYLLLH